MSTREDAERRYAQIEGERDYHKRRAERLEEERDALEFQKRNREGLVQRAIEMEEQYSALAAHVEDWRKGIALAKAWHWERDERGYAGSKKEADAFLDWLADRDQNDSPATSLARLKAECWKEAYLAGMEHGHHWTAEGGYVPGDEEAAEDYVADRQAEGGDA